MLIFKDGVKLEGLQPQMLIALQVVEESFGKYTLDTIVTSGSDGQHMLGSLHYLGRALDFRTHHAAGIMGGLFQMINNTLHPLGFDCVWESVGKPEEHLHVEYQPKD